MVNTKKVGVLVRYNPCSIYARGGIPCPHFKNGSKRCSKPPKRCKMMEYDKWFREVLAGRIRYFHVPRRIWLFEISGTPLFIYHSHQKKIVGEASVIKVTKENKIFYYWFDQFLRYPNFVDLTEIKTDKGLQKMAGKGMVRIMYLDEGPIKEIRDHAQLSHEVKQKLAEQLQDTRRKIVEMPKIRYRSYQQDKLAFVRSTLEEIKLKHKVDDVILNTAYQIFTEAIKIEMQRGRRTLDLIYASLYTAYRLLKTPLTSNEFSKLYGLKSKKLIRNYHTLLKSLSLTVPRQSPRDFMLRYSQYFPISEKTRKLAISTIESLEKSRTVRKSPRVVAATVTYIACKKNNEVITQVQIAKAFGISSASIRNCIKLLHKLPRDVLNI